MPDDPITSTDRHARRTVLRSATVLGGVALSSGILAACGSDDEADDVSGGAGSADDDSGDTAGAAVEVGSAKDIPVGGGTIFPDEKVVVTQPAEGEFKAFSSICTHAGCPVAEISGDVIKCDCHGSEFSIEDGSVVSEPATEPLEERTVTVQGGKVSVKVT